MNMHFNTAWSTSTYRCEQSMLEWPKSCETVSILPVLASTLPANVRRPEWLDPLIPAFSYSLVKWDWSESHALYSF